MMGLDVVAFERVSKISAVDDPDDTGTTWLSNSDFPERSDGMEDGHYSIEGATLHFAAGAYSGYGRWRNQLAQHAWGCGSTYEMRQDSDWEPYRNSPFFEIVFFTDCDGFIGPKTAAKLAKDFAEWEERMEQLSANDDDPYHKGGGFMGKYRSFMEAFKLAAGAGAVKYT